MEKKITAEDVIKSLGLEKKPKFSLNVVKWRFIMGRDKQDAEKMLLPAIVFINTNHNSFNYRKKGFMICIGWWDWSIKIGLIII
jgi:hypothetical protein